MRKGTPGLLSLMMAVGLFVVLPPTSIGGGTGGGDSAHLQDTARRTLESTSQAVAKAQKDLSDLGERARKALAPKGGAGAGTRPAARTPRAPTTTPTTDPPLHGTNNHGQGTVGVVDIAPSNERPQGGNPDGSDAGPEDVVAGRARGEQQADGSYHGHVTVASLLGNELIGVDSTEGQSNSGPLDPVQTGVLDAVCDGTAQQICLSVLTADSSTTATGSTNDFAVARAQIGGATGLGVGAAESQGTINQDADCQTSTGTAKTANVTAGGGAVANAANSSSSSKSCRGQAPVVTNTSQVIGLGGTNVPLPAPGCADGTPDTVTGIPVLAPIICNADTIAGATGVREALDVFVLSVGDTTLTKETTAASESVSTAPAETAGGPQCSDGIDNDGDGLVDSADPGCHTDGNPNNPASFNPNDTSEANGTPACSDGKDNDGDGKVDAADPGCHTDGNANNPDSFNPNDTSEANGTPACSDGKDNDGDGKVDAADPGCHTDGNANNPDSFDANDTSEAGGSGNGGTLKNVDFGGGSPPQCSDNSDNDGDGLTDEDDPGCHTDGNADNAASYNSRDDSEGSAVQSGSLPFTGIDVVQLVLAGLMMMGGGLVLRRREGLLPRR